MKMINLDLQKEESQIILDALQGEILNMQEEIYTGEAEEYGLEDYYLDRIEKCSKIVNKLKEHE